MAPTLVTALETFFDQLVSEAVGRRLAADTTLQEAVNKIVGVAVAQALVNIDWDDRIDEAIQASDLDNKIERAIKDKDLGSFVDTFLDNMSFDVRIKSS